MRIAFVSAARLAVLLLALLTLSACGGGDSSAPPEVFFVTATQTDLQVIGATAYVDVVLTVEDGAGDLVVNGLVAFHVEAGAVNGSPDGVRRSDRVGQVPLTWAVPLPLAGEVHLLACASSGGNPCTPGAQVLTIAP